MCKSRTKKQKLHRTACHSSIRPREIPRNTVSIRDFPGLVIAMTVRIRCRTIPGTYSNQEQLLCWGILKSKTYLPSPAENSIPLNVVEILSSEFAIPSSDNARKQFGVYQQLTKGEYNRRRYGTFSSSSILRIHHASRTDALILAPRPDPHLSSASLLSP
jgi:hypothetical protein